MGGFGFFPQKIFNSLFSKANFCETLLKKLLCEKLLEGTEKWVRFLYIELGAI